MASNSFGELFRVTTFGESHGPAIGAVVDGCPAGLPLAQEEIDRELKRRRPGASPHTSPRKEPDAVEILSGLYEGKTTGAPIALLIRNSDVESAPYLKTSSLLRPGHAQFTYLTKYGHFDPRGGGRASARETAARVAAGAIAKKLLSTASIDCVAYLAEAGGIAAPQPRQDDLRALRSQIESSPLFCPDVAATERMKELLDEVIREGDSVGGIVACIAHLPPGLGDPVYQKLEANLASALLSLPASKGFEIGLGFASARMRGSEHNDSFVKRDEKIAPATNRAGGTLGGISTGEPLFCRVAFKPTSSIRKEQQTVTLEGEEAVFQTPKEGRHDPCVAIRAVPVVEAMCALVLADAWLKGRGARV